MATARCAARSCGTEGLGKIRRFGLSHVFIALAVSLGPFVLSGCSGEKGRGAPATETGPKDKAAAGERGGASRKFSVRTEVVATHPLEYEISAVGTLVEENRYEIPTRVAGVAENVAFSEGDRVTTGQELCRIDFSRYQLLANQARSATFEKEAAVRNAEAALADAIRETSTALETARIDLDLAETEYRRRADLKPGSVITPEDKKTYESRYRKAQAAYRDAVAGARTRVALAETELAEAKAAFESARSALAIALDNLEDAIVRAPISGRIQKRSVTNGQYLAPGSEIALMVQTDPIRLRFTVPESKAGALSRAMNVKFSVPALPDREFEALVYDVGATADPDTREVQSWARVSNADESLRPGYFTSVKIVTESKNSSVVVPLGAVLPTEFGTVVFVVQDGMAVRRPVKTGLQVTGDAIEILDGLEPGEQLVVEGMGSLQDNVAVTVLGSQDNKLPQSPGSSASGSSGTTRTQVIGG